MVTAQCRGPAERCHERRSIARDARTALVMVAVIGVAAVLGGCGLSSLSSGLSGTMFGGGSSKPAPVASVTEEQLLSSAKAEYGEGGINVGRVAHGCPKFDVAPTEFNTTTYEPGRDGDALGVLHRGEITRTARECNIGNGQVSVKYGFSGRVLLGPRGQTGRVVLPLTVYVTDASRARMTQEELSVAVDVSVENPIGYFSIVRTVTFPVPQGSRAGDFQVFVGFKPSGGVAG